MQMLEKLYENQYFGIILFAVIAILIIMFVAILFFGINDSKKDKKIKKKEKIEAEEEAIAIIDDTVKLDIPEVEEEIKEEVKISEEVIDDDVIPELPKKKEDID